MSLLVVVDPDRCMGSGNCMLYAPGTFAFDDDGLSTVVSTDADPESQIRQAAAMCPMRAISLSSVDETAR
jgi:ferredoxin